MKKLELRYIFTCPQRHEQLITENQYLAIEEIFCDQCEWMGFVDEGEVVEEPV